MLKNEATKERPFLNNIDTYIPEKPRTREDNEVIVWDVLGMQRQRRSHCGNERMEQIYNQVMNYFMTNEWHLYQSIQTGLAKHEDYERDVNDYLIRTFPEMRVDTDRAIIMDRVKVATYQYSVLQPLIDNPETSDIKVCGPNDIRVRIHGKAYKSNATFYDAQELYRFITGIAMRNHLALDKPMITFTDTGDAHYILRFVISAPMINAIDYPYMHIRKVPKNKPDFDKLIKDEMLPPIVKDYLIDRAKYSRGVVFAGPPGSGKTTALNAFIEYIPKTRETLVIQENDELFTNQSGFMFKHVTHGFQNEPIVTLEDLAKMALVEGCNEFVVGEVKGGEMRYVMTLLNAGGYAALTVHSTNAYETMDKLADLVKYGSDYSFDEARRMLKTFDTVVYMENYQIQEILEVDGYDDATHQFNYINMYKNPTPRGM